MKTSEETVNSDDGQGHCPVASLNFIDLRKNSGPSVNELEFSRWLLEVEPRALLLTPLNTSRLSSERIITFGKFSLKSPISALWIQQNFIAKKLARELSTGAVLYYRHTRLATAVLKLKKMRPDVRIAAVRMHPKHSDNLIPEGRGIRWLVSWLIESINFRLAQRVGRLADWVDCVTPRQAELLSAELGKPVHVVMNSVNTAIFAPISEERRAQVRRRIGILENTIVVGYCGGSPTQRGATEIAALVRKEPWISGVVVGPISSSERAMLRHERMHILGELPYEDVPEIVASFDIAIALDIPGRIDIVGNSNQKVRQALACGAWVLTQAADLPFETNPILGCNVSARDADTMSKVIIDAMPFLPFRQERAAFARERLDTAKLFSHRHDMLLKERNGDAGK